MSKIVRAKLIRTRPVPQNLIHKPWTTILLARLLLKQPAMSKNNDFSGKNAGDNGKPRELHAVDTETTQVAEAPDSKRFEIMLAGAASLTLIAFLGALWKILA